MRLALVVVLLLAGCRDHDTHAPPPPAAATPVPDVPLPTGPLQSGETVAARVDTIMQRVNLTNSSQIQQAEALLIDLGPPAIPEMIEQLKTGGKPAGGVDRRYVLARALRVHGAAASGAIPLLTPLLGGSERTLDQPQPPGSEVKIAIIENSELRNASAEALGAMGAVAIPALTDVLRSGDPVARTKAATALHSEPPGELDKLDANVADDLARALDAAIPSIKEQLTARRAQETLAQLRARSAK